MELNYIPSSSANVSNNHVSRESENHNSPLASRLARPPAISPRTSCQPPVFTTTATRGSMAWVVRLVPTSTEPTGGVLLAGASTASPVTAPRLVPAPSIRTIPATRSRRAVSPIPPDSCAGPASPERRSRPQAPQPQRDPGSGPRHPGPGSPRTRHRRTRPPAELTRRLEMRRGPRPGGPHHPSRTDRRRGA